MDPHVEQISPQTIHLHSVWWQSVASLHCEMYLHPFVQESPPRPGNNLVADWLVDGKNWKLKLEILVINRGGRKKVRWFSTAMRLGSLANEVFCLSWNACDTPPNTAGISRPGEKKRLPSYLRLQTILLILLEICIVPLWFSPSCVTFFGRLICQAPDM